MTLSAQAGSTTARRRRRWPLIALLGAVLAVTLSYGLMKGRVFRAPYPALGKQYAWLLGCQEPAYNFGVVVPGRIYRSCRPDVRFLRYVRDRHGVRHVVSLNGQNEWTARAKELDLRVTVFAWSSHTVPPEDQLRQVLDLLDGPEPVLVHCSAGADRTGYAVAAYRIQRMGWPTKDALQEMDGYWHHRDKKPARQEALERMKQPAAAPAL